MSVVVGVIVVVVVLVVVAAALVALQRRRAHLQERFGAEYERAVSETGSKRQAEKELRERQEAHEQLELRPLTPQARERFSEQWQSVQAGFVDTPAAALHQADALVTRLLEERGYPTGDFDERSRMLSVEHAASLESYRRAHEVEVSNQAGTASIEQVRDAFLDLRRVFEEVMAQGAGAGEAYPDEPSAAHPAPASGRPVER